MTRTISGAMTTALTSDHVPFVLLIELQLDSGTQRYTTAGHDLPWDSQTWAGIGTLVDVSEIREGETLEAIGLRLSLSSVPSALIAIALSEHVQGKTCRIWAAALADGVIVTSPSLEFQGRIDTLETSEDGETGSIVVNIESRLADFARPRVRRYSDADQKQLYPGDKGFEYVAAMVEAQIVWPGKEYFQK